MTAKLFTLPKQTPFTNAGALIPGAKAHFFLYGTSTPQDTYTTSSLDVANTNPVIADGNGRFGPIYLDSSLRYKVQITDASDVEIYTEDDFQDTLDAAEVGAALYPQTSEESTAGVTPTDYSKEPGNVLRYGTNTVPGTTDMTTAIQNALDSNNDVYLPAGTYFIGDSKLIPAANTVIRGDGDISLITTDGSTKSVTIDDNVFDVLVSNVTIRDIAIHGDYGNAPNQFNGIYVDNNPSNIKILNVTFIDHGAPIWLTHCDGVIIDGCRFTKETKNGHGLVGQANEVTDLITNVRITNNYFGESLLEGIDCQSYCTYWVIANNHFYKNHTTVATDSDVIDIGGQSGSNNHIVIDGNTCDNQGVANTFAWIKQGTNHVTISNNIIKNTKTAGYGAFRLGFCRDVAVVGNVVESCPRVAQFTGGGSAPTDTRTYRVTISGNVGRDLEIDGVEALAINPTFGDALWGLTISDNHFHTTTGTGSGIKILRAFDVTISGNTIDGFAGNGIQMDNTDEAVIIWTITGNVIRACGGDGLYIKADRGTITGNHVEENTGYGLNVAGDSDYVAVTGNMFYNNTAGEVTGLTNLKLASSVKGNSPPVEIVYTLADDGTPYVGSSGLYKTGGTTTITDFDFGEAGQTITILAEHAITITDNAAIILNGGANFVMASGDTLTLTMFNDQIWHEVSRSVN